MPSARTQYIERVIDLYRRTPDTCAYIRKADRSLAAKLHQRGVSIQAIEHALILATARRTFRATDLPPLAPIASLHYLLPILHELTTQPPQPGYFDYLRHALARHRSTDDGHQIP